MKSRSIFYAAFLVATATMTGAVAHAREPVGTPDPSKDHPLMTEARYWTISPRVGPSYATGIFGVEAQRGRFGIAVGALCIPSVFSSDHGFACFPTTALKYFLSETGDSWSLAVFHWRFNREDGTVWGIGAEHRWRWPSRMEFSLGIGVGRLRDRDEDTTIAWPSLSVGYAF